MSGSFQTLYLVPVLYDSVSGYIQAAGNSVTVDYIATAPDGVFDFQDLIAVESGSYQSELYYMGHTEDGWIGSPSLSPVSSIPYFSNTPLLTGDVIPFSTGSITCFLAGTLILCPDGERAVEDLAVGDEVLTATGAPVPLRWIGRQTVAPRFAAVRSYPVRIAAGALGEDLPKRDLYVSPTHAMLIDGVLVQARALVNGTTIIQTAPQAERFTYYHLEFDTHTIVLAEGAATESFVDSNESRRRFDNYAEFVALYGEDTPVAEPCDLPRVTVSRQLPRRLKAQLAAIAGKAETSAADVA